MNRLVFRHALLLGLAALLLAGLPGSLLADGGGGGGGSEKAAPRDPQYEKAASLIQQGRFEQAIPLLEQVVAKNSGDADAYNLLGFSSRKLGKLEQALAYYDTALRINPKHRGAHEYRGEAYLQMGKLDMAKEELVFLDNDCWMPCDEFNDLKAAVARYEAQARR